jgi:hypothetical protein
MHPPPVEMLASGLLILIPYCLTAETGQEIKTRHMAHVDYVGKLSFSSFHPPLAALDFKRFVTATFRL